MASVVVEQPLSIFGVEADWLNDPMLCWAAIGELEDRGWDYAVHGRSRIQVRVEFYRGGITVRGQGESFMLAFVLAVKNLPKGAIDALPPSGVDLS